MKLLGSTKSKITKDENGENVSYLEITELVLIQCNVVNNSYQQNSRVLYTKFKYRKSNKKNKKEKECMHTFVPDKSLGQF